MQPPVIALTPADAPAVARVQAACYAPALMESAALYARRLASPAHCSLGVPDGGGVLLAYLAACWSVRGAATPLHGEFTPHAHADTLYLHDMAVLPTHAGRGLAQALLAAAWRAAQARGVRRAALVSVQGTAAFWRRQGFEPATAPVGMGSYGEGALYMIRELPDFAADIS
ncbi:GNAT family N-acetyltransferase [Ottowia sp.]|uniref:GNAT family N-acetyltransferase n=1 Tax=Ottowia sp. TaxID=1898956 RepID=UPI0039E55A80